PGLPIAVFRLPPSVSPWSLVTVQVPSPPPPARPSSANPKTSETIPSTVNASFASLIEFSSVPWLRLSDRHAADDRRVRQRRDPERVEAAALAVDDLHEIIVHEINSACAVL